MPDLSMMLPDFLDPVLSYLSDTLPQPLYSFLINALSHCLAVLTAVYALITPLLSTNPFEWDAQTLLPPLITLLAAYLALVSFYRTTTWMLRTSVFLVKWGTLFGTFVAALAWVMGNANANGNGVAAYGLMSTIRGIVLDYTQGKKRNGRSSRSRSQAKPLRTRGEKRKPKPWESFERHREWQYDESQGNTDAQNVISDILGTTGKYVKESGWWKAVKGVVEGGTPTDTVDSESKGGEKQPKTKAGSSRSR
ncbi:hypothetical protein FPV67DRAFT_1486896 [Lyophyllum atratum]|nr:hypothetical protein FPV67DRAFT_1486896 [Lyophyllum atratum]